MRDNTVIVETGATSEEARIISRVNGIGSPRNKGINGRNHHEQENRTVTFAAMAILPKFCHGTNSPAVLAKKNFKATE